MSPMSDFWFDSCSTLDPKQMLPLAEIIMAMWPGIDANFEVQLLEDSDGVQDLSKFVRTDAGLPPGEWATLGVTLATKPVGTTERDHFMTITLKQVLTAAGVKHCLYFHDGSSGGKLRRVDADFIRANSTKTAAFFGSFELQAAMLRVQGSGFFSTVVEEKLLACPVAPQKGQMCCLNSGPLIHCLGLDGLVDLLAASGSLLVPIDTKQQPMLQAQNLLQLITSADTIAWEFCQEQMAVLFETCLRVVGTTGSGEPQLYDRRVQCDAGYMMQVWLRLLCGDLKQADWGATAIRYSRETCSKDELLKNLATLPYLHRSLLVEAWSFADHCTRLALHIRATLPPVYCSKAEVVDANNTVDIAFSAVVSWLRGWLDLAAKKPTKEDLQSLQEAVTELECNEWFWWKHAFVKPLLHAAGFRESLFGTYNAKAWSDYTESERQVSAAMVDVVICAAKRINLGSSLLNVEGLKASMVASMHTSSESSGGSQVPSSGGGGGGDGEGSNTTTGSKAEASGGSRAPGSGSGTSAHKRLAGVSGKYETARLERDLAVIAAFSTMCEEDHDNIMDNTVLQDRLQCLIEYQESDASRVANAAVVSANVIPMFAAGKMHIAINHLSAKGHSSFLTQIGSQGSPRVDGQFTPTGKGLVCGTQLGSRGGAESGYFYPGVVCLSGSPQALLPTAIVSDDKELLHTAGDDAFYTGSAAYRQLWFRELEVLVPGFTSLSPDEGHGQLAACGSDKLLAFFQTCRLEPATAGSSSSSGADEHQAWLADCKLADCILKQHQAVVSAESQGENAFNSKGCIDECRPAPSSSSGIAALPQVVGVLRPSMAAGDFRVIVQQTYVDADGVEQTIIRTGPWSQLANSPLSVKVISDHVAIGEPAGSICMGAVEQFLDSGWCSSPRVAEDKLASLKPGDISPGACLWVEEKGAKASKLRTYYQAPADVVSTLSAQPVATRGSKAGTVAATKEALPFVCTVPGCDRSFSKVQSLNAHMRYHNKVSPKATRSRVAAAAATTAAAPKAGAAAATTAATARTLNQQHNDAMRAAKAEARQDLLSAKEAFDKRVLAFERKIDETNDKLKRKSNELQAEKKKRTEAEARAQAAAKASALAAPKTAPAATRLSATGAAASAPPVDGTNTESVVRELESKIALEKQKAAQAPKTALEKEKAAQAPDPRIQELRQQLAQLEAANANNQQPGSSQQLEGNQFDTSHLHSQPHGYQNNNTPMPQWHQQQPPSQQLIAGHPSSSTLQPFAQPWQQQYPAMQQQQQMPHLAPQQQHAQLLQYPAAQHHQLVMQQHVAMLARENERANAELAAFEQQAKRRRVDDTNQMLSNFMSSWRPGGGPF